MVQKKVLSSGQVLKVRVKILSTNPPKWMYHVKEMNKETISNWAKKQTCRSMVFNVEVVIDGEANSLTVWDCTRSQKTQKYDTNNIMSSRWVLIASTYTYFQYVAAWTDSELYTCMCYNHVYKCYSPFYIVHYAIIVLMHNVPYTIRFIQQWKFLWPWRYCPSYSESCL